MKDESKSAQEALVFECELDEPLEKVWRALTEPALLAAWLMPNDFVAKRGHRFRFTPTEPGQPNVHCQVLAIEPKRRLELSWREEGAAHGDATPLTTVSFVLEHAAVGTLLRVTHRGGAPQLERRLAPASAHALASAIRTRAWRLAA